MEKPKPATIAWGVLAAGVAAYEIRCPEGETLSEGVDRALENKKFKSIVVGGIAVTALHLCNVLPERLDPYHQLFKLKKFGDKHE